MKKETLVWGALIIGGFTLFGNLFKRPGQTEKDVDQAIQHARNQGLIPSFPPLQFKAFADGIYEALKYSAIADDKATAERILLSMHNDLDVTSLVQAYGRRRLYVFGIPEGGLRTLWQTITSELSQSRLNRINADWQKKGIRYRF